VIHQQTHIGEPRGDLANEVEVLRHHHETDRELSPICGAPQPVERRRGKQVTRLRGKQHEPQPMHARLGHPCVDE
jgi:hypothetical protein